ncbi:MAG: preprotein translocase subunit SecE [Gemmataceae bacterium]
MIANDTLATGARNLALDVPFAEGWEVVLLPDVRFTLPLLLVAGSLWFAFRVVNLPVFADFLIATEAEMNKVSWTTRKRLVQDTIVVLVTVFLMTVFLFAVDQLWILTLRQKWLGGGILRIDNTSGNKGSSDSDKDLTW